MNKQSSTKREIAARENGSYGGQKRAARHHTIVLSEWGSWGGKSVLEKYGREHFVEMRKRRKSYPKYKSPADPPNWRAMAAKKNGRKGGNARAAIYSPEHLREWGRLGGIATRERHGNQFFKEIRKLRTVYRGKGYLTQKTKQRIRQEAIRQSKIEPNWAIAELWSAVAKTWE